MSNSPQHENEQKIFKFLHKNSTDKDLLLLSIISREILSRVLLAPADNSVLEYNFISLICESDKYLNLLNENFLQEISEKKITLLKLTTLTTDIQIEAIQTINHAKETNLNLLLALPENSLEQSVLLPDLKSRILSSITISINKNLIITDFPKLLTSLLQENGIRLPKNIIEYCTANAERNTSYLFFLINEIVNFIAKHKKTLTKDDIITIIKNY